MTFNLLDLPIILQRVLGSDATVVSLDGEIYIRSTYDPPSCIVFPETALPTEFDGSFISSVMRRHQLFTERAIDFVRQHQVNPEHVADRISFPQFIFRLNCEFDIHFQSCEIEANNNGLVITFEQETPVSAALIQAVDAYWDEETNAWVQG